MAQFKKILFVIDEGNMRDEAFTQAVQTASQNGAALSVLALHPAFPQDMDHVALAFRQAMESKFAKKLDELGFEGSSALEFSCEGPHFITIIRKVIEDGYDLLIKAAQDPGGQKRRGFKSLDMSLLRKCPCPLWLYRPLQNAISPSLAVCIDPLSEEPEGRDLGVQLLKNAAALSENFKTNYVVLSCWDFEYEGFARNAPFAKMEDSKVDAMIEDIRVRHEQALKEMITQADVPAPADVICKRGEPGDVIPAYTDAENIDILMMGTVARTGIPGFFIGNTAENIIRTLNCSLFAMKPDGFISPVKA